MNNSSTQQPDVLIIGAGPTGLTAATKLRQLTDVNVLVVERENSAGGIPRHSNHTGYGVRDLRRVTSGPQYAKLLARKAARAGVDILVNTTVTHWHPETGATCTSPQGITQISPRITLLTTGARERPRPARMIPGFRPAGVLTTGELQNKVHLEHQEIGKRAVIIGAQLVSWSAVMTLKEAGCETVALTSEYPRPESYGLFNIGGPILFGTKVLTRVRVVQILGRHRVSGVEIEQTTTGERDIIPCDTVITTGDWIPDHELARMGGLSIDPHTKGPVVDGWGHTSSPGVFAAGNCVHPVATADLAALSGKYSAKAIAHSLDAPPQELVLKNNLITPGAHLAWVTPGVFDPHTPPARRRILAWPNREIMLPVVTARQGGKEIGRQRLPWPASPGRVLQIPWSLLSQAQAGAGDITISL